MVFPIMFTQCWLESRQEPRSCTRPQRKPRQICSKASSVLASAQSLRSKNHCREWNSLKWQSQPQGNRFQLLPGTALSAPWIALRGELDQICPATTVEAFVKQVNHGTFMLRPSGQP